MSEIAQTPQAKFEYWIQEKWNVLPTDPRYRDLTEEQLELLYEHYLRSLPPEEKDEPDKEDGKFRDPDYKEPDGTEETVDSDGAVIPEHEHFEDPDFADAWNADDEEEFLEDGNSSTSLIGENHPHKGSERFSGFPKSTENPPINFDDFEEV